MAYEIPLQKVTVPAGADLSTQQFRFVTLNASGQAINPASTSFVRPFGVLQDKPSAAGQAAVVMTAGLTKVAAAASTLSAGDFVSASTDGLAVGLSTGFVRVGRIVSGSSGGAGRILTISLEPWGTT